MKIAIIALSILLIGSNVFWLSQAVDAGIAESYRESEIWQLDEARKQLMASLPELASSKTKAEVIRITERFTEEETFEKDGCTWVGWLGLRFDSEEKLISVFPSWSDGQEGPCYENL